MSTPKLEVRKIVTLVEEIRHDGGPPPDRPQKKGAVAVVLANPYAGRYVEDIVPMMEALKPLGLEMARRPTYAATSTPWRSACRMRRARTRSCIYWP